MPTHIAAFVPLLALAVGVQAQIDCPGTSNPGGASLLQKENRLQKAVFQQGSFPEATSADPTDSSLGAAQRQISQAWAHIDDESSRNTSPLAPDETEHAAADPYHSLLFSLILIFGTALHVMPTSASWAIRQKGKAEDSIPKTELAAGTLEDNASLLKHESIPPTSSLLDLLPQSSATALCRDGPEPDAITYHQLREQLLDPEFASAFLPHDRVALILENGKEMAVCILAVMHTACAVPLNPTFTAAEIAASMEQLKCTAAIIQRGQAGEAARQAASSLGLQTFTLQEGHGKLLSLQGPRPATRAQPVGKGPREVLMLKTSGTTSKGKVVTFTLERLSQAARSNARCVELAEGSVCLSMMPLYHIAGISVNFLASLSAGSTVLFYTGLFDVKRFTAELERTDEYRPTWYFAVPAVHEAVLSHGAELGRPFQHGLRLIRSAGAALPQKTGLRLIETFACAVTPAYGMTEALEITCPPATYQLERPGSVGPSINAEIKLINGEICIKGDLVMPGYEFHGADDDDPNREAWTGGSAGKGYLRTGDLGHMDSDGWLFLTGRCKEMINRGGETINPHEVEPAIASHPDIDISVCFAAPHQALGECVAAAVVLKEGASPQELTPKTIVEFCSSQASETMRPEIFVYLPSEALPKTATKKFIRAGLAGRLGLTLDMIKTSTAFVYNNGSLEPALLESAEVIVKNSLGQLRQVSNQDRLEQQLKDGIFGFGIIQVITKHWYQGQYNDIIPMVSTIRTGFKNWEEAELFTMSLFFLLSGHTAYQATKSGAGALFTRWLGLYIIMTFTFLLNIATTSLRVDWYFAWLLMMEMFTVAISMACSKLPAGSGYWFSTMLTTIPWILLAAWTKEQKMPSQSEVLCPLTHTWSSILLGNIDKQPNWAGGLLCCWAFMVSIGFHLLPYLSQLCRSSKHAGVALNKTIRALSSVGFLYLLFNHSNWPRGAGTPEDAAEDYFQEVATVVDVVLKALVMICLLAVAIGPHASFLQTLGKYSVGCLMSQTAFSGFTQSKFCVLTAWPFHDCSNFRLLMEVGGRGAALTAMLIAPFMFTLSIGKWTTQLVDVALKFPAISLLIWAIFVASTPLISAAPGEPSCSCPQ